MNNQAHWRSVMVCSCPLGLRSCVGLWGVGDVPHACQCISANRFSLRKASKVDWLGVGFHEGFSVMMINILINVLFVAIIHLWQLEFL